MLAKLQALGPSMPYPHGSDIRGARGLWTLRPPAGRSPWRAFYRRIRDELVVGAIGPEAERNPRGFQRAVQDAQLRLDDHHEERTAP